MPFHLADTHLALIDEARAVAAVVAPFAAEADELQTVHPGVRDALAASELWQVLVPAAHGGRFETVDPLAVTVVREVLMGTSAHLDSLFALQGVGSYAITAGGTPQQRDAWLPRVVTGEAIAALALTEPEAGSDLKAITTALRADGDGLVLDGAKAFISNAGAAAFYTVLARDGDGYSMVLVPADAPGLSVTPGPQLISPHVIGDLAFDAVALPGDARLGEPGRGFDLVLATLSMFRVSVAGAALGVAQAALEEATRHAARREQFGRPMARLGAVASMLADSWSELEAARLLTYAAAEQAAADPLAALERCSMAKLLASETAGRVVDRCVQVMGRWGLIRDAKVERLYRQARPMRIYEGGSEVLRLGIARALVRELADDAPATA
ncbi:acyl-CoA dehydrogenase family protein [Conexibacter sp. CPCC 206217]|uniref:acyl-CoA dehydrogenase family protein n=1 Tax=Conexibacter sp. CPCC 206217 TaxID=3064574 RepID=UPI002723EEDD|nr:acyl-CoA dehydrogenase family protein [Conexibacter sp. CPCC 206217]MDO8212591.1 acyl-CoA dehydrogenase family protein [Conexibacter sp. CPCC 206217]